MTVYRSEWSSCPESWPPCATCCPPPDSAEPLTWWTLQKYRVLLHPLVYKDALNETEQSGHMGWPSTTLPKHVTVALFSDVIFFFFSFFFWCMQYFCAGFTSIPGEFLHFVYTVSAAMAVRGRVVLQ